MKRILCFGDSLTHGTMPISADPVRRYDFTRRWTGILQSKLEEAIVIEEGLPSRTIDKDDPRPDKEGRNGSAYLWPCIGSHVPLDVVVLWLGTNDTKDVFESSAEDIARSHRQMLIGLQKQMRQYSPDCKYIILSPPQMHAESEGAKAWYSNAQQKLAMLPALYEETARELGVAYIDTYHVLGVPAVPDGIHLSEEQNIKVAELVHNKLQELGVT